jgi:hypothetical protein
VLLPIVGDYQPCTSDYREWTTFNCDKHITTAAKTDNHQVQVKAEGGAIDEESSEEEEYFQELVEMIPKTSKSGNQVTAKEYSDAGLPNIKEDNAGKRPSYGSKSCHTLHMHSYRMV